jgi:hypothetical protein
MTEESALMIDRRLLASSLAFSVLTLTGCPQGHATVALENLPAELAHAQCAAATRCGIGLGIYETYLLHEQITDCDAQLAAYLDASALGAIRSGIADGSIVYHADMAGACVDAYEDAACGGTSGAPAACLGTFEGTVADGAPCSNPEQCSSTSTCDSSHLGMCPSGVCVHVAQLGEACTTSCGNGLRCASGTCAAPARAGEACNPSGGAECDGALACIPGSDPTHGTCGTVELAGVGEPCGRGCEANLVCGASGTCRAPRTDGTCEVTYVGAGDCQAGEECATDAGAREGSCEPLPSAGEPCTSVCARGSRCSGTADGAHTCIAPLANGAACETSSQCLSDYCASGSCAAPPVCRPS